MISGPGSSTCLGHDQKKKKRRKKVIMITARQSTDQVGSSLRSHDTSSLLLSLFIHRGRLWICQYPQLVWLSRNVQGCRAIQGRFPRNLGESLNPSRVPWLKGTPLPAVLRHWLGATYRKCDLDVTVILDFRVCSWTATSVTHPIVGSLHHKFSWPP